MRRKRFHPRDVDAPPTVRTVADHAGVSVASASRVLNGRGASPEVDRKVRTAADDLGYVPNAVARSLQARRTDMLALAVADVGNPVYVAMMRAIEEVATAAGYRLQVHATAGSVRDEIDLLAGLARRYVDGMIICPIRLTQPHLDALSRTRVPVTVIGTMPADTSEPPVTIDNVRADSHTGVSLAINHLVETGRRRIGFINGPTDTVPGKARRNGYIDALRDAGVDYDENLIEPAQFHFEDGRDATERLIARASPDAILCANDLIAMGALHALLAAGVRVPEEIALVGMDNTDLTRMAYPQLSSVSLGSARRGRLAAELLLARLDDPARSAQHTTVSPQLHVRASSCAHAAEER